MTELSFKGILFERILNFLFASRMILLCKTLFNSFRISFKIQHFPPRKAFNLRSKLSSLKNLTLAVSSLLLRGSLSLPVPQP